MGKGNDGKDASSLKEAGNKAFASGDLVEAHRLYTEALDCSGDSSAQVINFRATVLSNRAMVLFKQGKASECAADCTSALELDPGRVKAYFRRSLAREQLGEDADALRDAKRALELDPGNKEAVKAARRIKDKVAKAVKLNTPVVQALKALREAAEKVQKHGQDAPTGAAQAPAGKDVVAGKEQIGEAATSFSEEDTAQSKVMLALGALVSSEPAAGMQLLREGCMAPLSVCLKAASTFPNTAKEALRVLGAASQHKAFGLVLLKTQGVELLSDLADILVEEGARSDVGEGSPVAEAVLSTSVHLLQWDEPAVVDRLDELPEVNREQVEDAGKELADAAVKVLAQGLKMPNREVFDTALEAVVRWCSPRSDDEPKASDDGNLPAKEAYEKRQKAHRRRVRLSLWVRDKGLALLSSSAVVSLYKALSSEEAVERRKASACLSRVGRAVTSVQANEKEREADSQKIKDAVAPLLQFQPEAGGSSVAETKGEGDAFAAISSESRMQGTVRRVTTASALANAEGTLGTWAMSLQGFLAEAMTLAASGDPIGQEAAAESFCSAASSDGGRALLGPVVESGVIFVLMESRSQAARSAAASAYAKLGMISSALSSDSDDVTKLLNVSLDLIAPSTKPKAARADAASSNAAASKSGRGLDTLKGGAELADSERAVEVLSFLVSKTKVKEELCYGSARCQKALSRLCQAGHHVKGTSPIAYGLAFLYSSLCVSKEEEVKESFKGKDMTYEQYQQLKQLNDSHGQGPKEDETDTKDSADAAKRRSHALAEAGCVMSLKKLAEDASPATRERVALCFRRLATEPLNRGLIVQQGGLSLLINMAATPSVGEVDSATKKDEKGKGCITEARHAIAKTLVTTNPHLLTEAQTMGSVPALIAMCRDHESLNLQQFECLLALTNLASLDNVRSRIIAEKGISCFHYLQFSDHDMLRRASTEAMCNLLPHQKMIDHLKSGDTLKLWAAFAQLGTEDPPTAAAALGCLAMAFRDPEVATGFMADEVGGCDALVHALLSVEPDIPNADDLILRAAVATSHLAEQRSLRSLLLLGGVADALTEAIAVSKEKDTLEAARAADACTSALEALKQEMEMPSIDEGLLGLD